jgi:hypothetical protein
LCIKKFSAYAISDETEIPLKYPPIHLHHIYSQTHFFSVHGDQYDNINGFKGYVHESPNGTCVPYNKNGDMITGVIQHVASSQENVLKFRIRITYDISINEEESQVSAVEIAQPIVNVSFQSNDLYNRFCSPSYKNILMYSARVNTNSTLLLSNIWSHTHPSGIQRLLILKGELPAIPNTFIPVNDLEYTYQQFSNHFDVLCKIEDYNHEIYQGHEYERYTPLECMNSNVTGLEYITIVAFLNGNSTPMHIIIWLYTYPFISSYTRIVSNIALNSNHSHILWDSFANSHKHHENILLEMLFGTASFFCMTCFCLSKSIHKINKSYNNVTY